MSDWWAVGVIAYELVFGVRPFKDSHSIEKDIVFPNAARIPHQDSFKDLIRQLLNKSPDLRLGNEEESNG